MINFQSRPNFMNAKLLITVMLLTIVFALSSVTAEEILSGKDVIAYKSKVGLFLMDADSGNEIMVPTANEIDDVFWDKTGARLFRTMAQPAPDQEFIFELYEVILPALSEVKLTEQQYDNFDNTIDDIAAGMGTDGKIYVSSFMWSYLADGTPYKTNLRTWGFYDLEKNTYQALENPSNFKPEYYSPKMLKSVTSEGYGITNQLVDDGGQPRFELFNVLSKGDEKPVFTPLTFWEAPAPNIHLKLIPTDFLLSPNDSLVVYSYHYFTNDPNSDLPYTWVCSRDGKRKKFLSDTIGVTMDHTMVWTSGSRLIYLTKDKENDSTLLCLLQKDLSVKELKKFEAQDTPFLYYRYRL